MIRTRFAPSPTGFLHIGGVRTALFNWLFARQNSGKFILRIDDTDADRNNPKATQPILDGFRWLGIDWDEGPELGGPHQPYYQSERKDYYHTFVGKLLEVGAAYRDGLATRFRVPPGKTTIDDLIRGKIEWDNSTIKDPVLVRSDGHALYNLATVVDDYVMQITHILRAEEHLSNTPVQVMLYKALDLPIPKFGHLPFVCEPGSHKKLSKRDMKKFVTGDVYKSLRMLGWTDKEIDNRDDLNPATLAFYKELGYIPTAIINYLARLGWSLDGETEKISLKNLTESFSLDRITKGPASFDPVKLLWLNSQYMKDLPLYAKLEGTTPYLNRVGIQNINKITLAQVIESCGDRLKLLSDIITYGAFFFRDPQYDMKAVQKRLLKDGVPELLEGYTEKVLRNIEPFHPDVLEKALQDFCEKKKANPADLIHALRVAVTGVTIGPSVFHCLAILGREEVLKRITEAAHISLVALQTNKVLL